VSVLTKKALLKALGHVLERKPFKKITVQDLTQECGISRMTFYYHFKDIYDMLEWALETEMEEMFKQSNQENCADWLQGCLRVFHFALAHKEYALKLLPVMDQTELADYLYEVAYRFTRRTVNTLVGDRKISEEDKCFVAENWTFCMIGTLLKWGRNGMKERPEDIVRRFAILFDEGVTGLLDRLAWHDVPAEKEALPD